MDGGNIGGHGGPFDDYLPEIKRNNSRRRQQMTNKTYSKPRQVEGRAYRINTKFLKCLLLLLTSLTLHAQSPASTTSKLTWDYPLEELPTISRFVISIVGTTSNTLLVTNYPVNMSLVMTNLPNGLYTIKIAAQNTSGVLSETSDPLLVRWLGGRPTKPESTRIIQ